MRNHSATVSTVPPPDRARRCARPCWDTPGRGPAPRRPARGLLSAARRCLHDCSSVTSFSDCGGASTVFPRSRAPIGEFCWARSRGGNPLESCTPAARLFDLTAPSRQSAASGIALAHVGLRHRRLAQTGRAHRVGGLDIGTWLEGSNGGRTVAWSRIPLAPARA